MNPLLAEILVAGPRKWLMSPADRIAVVGLLQLLKPRNTLEIGANEGGCTQWLCRYSENVWSVDIVDRTGDLRKSALNLNVLTMKSDEAFALFKTRELDFDFIIIDGDHSRQGAENDLRNALEYPSVILVHDASNPDCREGYLSALKEHTRPGLYHNLNFHAGTLQDDGLWGGLGLILPDSDSAALSQSHSVYDALRSCLPARAGADAGPVQKLLRRFRP